MRTAFNILGPLLNPAGAAYGLIGVYSPAISHLMATTLQRLGAKRALVVHSHGLDELTPMGDAELLEVTPQGTRSYRSAEPGSATCLLSMVCHRIPSQAQIAFSWALSWTPDGLICFLLVVHENSEHRPWCKFFMASKGHLC